MESFLCILDKLLTESEIFYIQYGRLDSYRVATTQDKDEKESPKKKGGKDLDDLKKEVPLVRQTHRHIKTWFNVKRFT